MDRGTDIRINVCTDGRTFETDFIRSTLLKSLANEHTYTHTHIYITIYFILITVKKSFHNLMCSAIQSNKLLF